MQQTPLQFGESCDTTAQDEVVDSPAVETRLSAALSALHISERSKPKEPRIGDKDKRRLSFSTTTTTTMDANVAQALQDLAASQLATNAALSTLAGASSSGAAPPTAKHALGRIDTPKTFIRDFQSLDTWLEQWNNYYQLLGTNPSDTQRVLQISAKLDSGQVSWFTQWKTALEKQPNTATPHTAATAASNAFTAVTWSTFVTLLTKATYVISADHNDRTTLDAMHLGKLQDPGWYNKTFKELILRINEPDKTAYYRYMKTIDRDSYQDYVNLKDVDVEGGTALHDAMRMVEKLYVTKTGKAMDFTSAGTGNMGYASSAYGTDASFSQPTGAGEGHSPATLNAMQSDGSQRVGSQTYTGCNRCGSLTHYGRFCPLNNPATWKGGARKGNDMTGRGYKGTYKGYEGKGAGRAKGGKPSAYTYGQPQWYGAQNQMNRGYWRPVSGMRGKGGGKGYPSRQRTSQANAATGEDAPAVVNTERTDEPSTVEEAHDEEWYGYEYDEPYDPWGYYPDGQY